jgi:hypothetical protein
MFESRRLLECLETEYYQNIQELKIMILIMISWLKISGKVQKTKGS